jgi:hypothetical protein
MKELDSYLNDHLAGSVGALELIGHCADLYRSEQLGILFTEMKAGITTDQTTLRELMNCLDIEESKMRQASAWAGEKVSRALFAVAGNQSNGLGLLLALEALVMGIAGKQRLWHALSSMNLPRLEQFDFEELKRRAEEQLERVQTEQIRSARRALVDSRCLAM